MTGNILMVNYSNTKIYKIWSPQGANIYIGSTTKKYLSQRMNEHRSTYISSETAKATSKLIFEEYGIENCFIELLEAKDCKDKHESSQLEGHYIRTLDCVNKNIPGRTMKEYRETKGSLFLSPPHSHMDHELYDTWVLS